MRALVVALLLAFTTFPAHAQHVWPLPGVLHQACDEWIAEHPDFDPITENLPYRCLFHYAGWDCEQPWTPAGWLRPGGYCETKKSLTPSGTGNPVEHRKPCYHDNYPYPGKPV